MKIDGPFYADHNATTPCDPDVARVVVDCLVNDFGNPNSLHSFGRRAHKRLEIAREQISQCVDCDPDEVVFASGATESINLFVKGLAAGRSLTFLMSAIEHKAVIESVAKRTDTVGSVRILPVHAGGLLHSDDVTELCNGDVDVALIQAVNPETGVIQRVADLVQCAQSKGAVTFVDAAQALWKVPVSFKAWECDAMVISAHKAYGPKGAGALIVRKPVRGAISRLLDGGASGEAMRAGTDNVPAYVGFGACCELVTNYSSDWRKTVRIARDTFERILTERSSHKLTSEFSLLDRAPNTSSITFKGTGADLILSQLHDVAASYGSACASGAFEPSPVLLASGMTREDAGDTVRFSFGRDFSDADAIEVAERVLCAYQRCIAGDGC